MANYDIFSQPTGPVVPISLFADAATAGINAGNALPTGLTSAIQGGIKGFGQGLDFVGKQNANAISASEAQLKANQVQQIPTDNQLKQTELQNNQAIAQINQTKAAVDTTTQSLQIDDTQAKLQNDLAKNQQELQNRQEEDQFSKTWKSLDPQSQLDAVFGNQNTPFFADHPKAYQTYLTSALSNPLITPQQQQAAMIALKKGAIDNTYLHREDAARRQLGVAQGAAETTTAFHQLIANSGMTPEDIYANVGFARPGEFKVQDGNKNYLAIDPDTHAPISTPDLVDKTSGNFVAFDKRDGHVLNDVVQADEQKKILAAQSLRTMATGQVRQRALAQVTPPPSQQNGTQQQGQLSAQSTTAVGDPYKIQAQKVLAVPETTFTKIEPSLDLLKSKVLSTLNDPKLRNTPAGKLAIDQTVETIGMTISDAEFFSNPAIQALVTQSHVDEWNRSIDNKVAQSQNTSQTDQTLASLRGYATLGSAFGPSTTPNIADAWKLATPRNLYYQNQKAALTLKLNAIVKSISDQATSTQNQVINGVGAKNLVTNFVASMH